jgi:hypothetical protein
MSWSMIQFGDYWAHAHDIEQILFMTFAGEFFDSSPKFQSIAWLSDIDLSRFLDCEDKVCVFRQFLEDYRIWLKQLGTEISAEVVNQKTDVPFFVTFTGPYEVKHLVAFTSTVECVLGGDTSNEKVHRKIRLA